MPAVIEELPISVAIRLALDVVSYSNPLPPWDDPLTIDYGARERTIARMAERYLAGEYPAPPFEILVPTKRGTRKSWVVPSVNDQIVLQACVSALAERVGSVPDPRRVFSYRLNTDPSRLQLVESQVSAWSHFQNETRQRLESHAYLLQFDLKAAFDHIDPQRFFAFMDSHVLPGRALDLLKISVQAFGQPKPGLPLINDSLFFLGNAYLTVVDRIVATHAPEFIRFVDDYRVFGPSASTLERALAAIDRALLSLGFTLNPSKIRLGSAEEYLDAIAKVRYSVTEGEDGYISAAVFDDVMTADVLSDLVARAVRSPDDYLNEGFGRLCLSAIRRMRLNAEVALIKNYPESPLDKFTERVGADANLIRAALALLEQCADRAEETWRTVWLLYLLRDLVPTGIKDRHLAERAKASIEQIGDSDAVPLVSRIWARRLIRSDIPKQQSTEELHTLGYLEAGIRCCEEANGQKTNRS